MAPGRSILAMNGGSSTIRFATFFGDPALARQLSGKIERIGLPATKLAFTDSISGVRGTLEIEAGNSGSAVARLIEWLNDRIGADEIAAVAHRIVHGMKRTESAVIDDALIGELERNIPFDPEHLPHEIEIVRACRRSYPDIPHIACFDTAFHRDMPRVAKLLPIPRRYEAEGLVRYGFHGLSYAYLMEELASLAGEEAARGRVIAAHLGSGASLCAVLNGKSVDTTMAFTPAAGIPMSTRSGDLDPGVAWYLMSQGALTPEGFNHLINHESGLMGISEISSDVRDLLAKESGDERAAEAIAMFCYQTKKAIGSLAAALGGVDTLIFSGGIGENSPVIRARVCEGLEFLGIDLHTASNQSNQDLISAVTSKVAVRVIPTDEELMMARLVRRFVDTTGVDTRRS